MSHRSRSPSQRRRTRGIRGGPAARRRRLAYIDHRLAEGEIWDNIPVHHAGGQARPLFTSRYWSPTRSEESEQDLIGGEAEEEVVNLEVSSSEGEEVIRLTQPIQPVYLAPRPKPAAAKVDIGGPAHRARILAAEPSSSSSGQRPPEPSSPPPGFLAQLGPREPEGPPPSRLQRPPEAKGLPPQRSQQQFLKSEDLPGVRVWRVGADHIPHEIWLEQVPVCTGRFI